jgi:hypothetical protein
VLLKDLLRIGHHGPQLPAAEHAATSAKPLLRKERRTARQANTQRQKRHNKQNKRQSRNHKRYVEKALATTAVEGPRISLGLLGRLKQRAALKSRGAEIGTSYMGHGNTSKPEYTRQTEFQRLNGPSQSLPHFGPTPPHPPIVW